MTCNYVDKFYLATTETETNGYEQLRCQTFGNAGDRAVTLYMHKSISRVVVAKQFALRDCIIIDDWLHLPPSHDYISRRRSSHFFQRVTNSPCRDILFFGDFSFRDINWEITSKTHREKAMSLCFWSVLRTAMFSRWLILTPRV